MHRYKFEIGIPDDPTEDQACHVVDRLRLRVVYRMMPAERGAHALPYSHYVLRDASFIDFEDDMEPLPLDLFELNDIPLRPPHP